MYNMSEKCYLSESNDDFTDGCAMVYGDVRAWNTESSLVKLKNESIRDDFEMYQPKINFESKKS